MRLLKSISTYYKLLVELCADADSEREELTHALKFVGGAG